MSPFALLLCVLLFLSPGDAQGLRAEPTCWFPQPRASGTARVSRFAVDRVLVWGIHGDLARNVSIAPMENWLAPAAYNGGQPTEFPEGDYPHFYALTIAEGRTLPDHGLAWVLLGAVGRVHERFFDEAHLCVATAATCAPEVAGFCNGLDACRAQATCDPDSHLCVPPSPDAQICPGDKRCDLRERRCVDCFEDADCPHDWCVGETTYCDRVSGTCAPRGPSPCAGNAFGCDATQKQCLECAADTDCAAPDGQFCLTAARCANGMCVLAGGKSPCPGQICVESERRCLASGAVRATEASPTKVPLIVGLEGDTLGGCHKDEDCWDRPTSEYAWCEGGVPYCDLELRQCTRHPAPSCGSGTCDLVLDTCTGCHTNADCDADEFWCHPRLCDHSAGLCIPAPASRCGESTCLESVRLCAQELCTFDANCTSSFCGGEQKCNLSTGSCYVVPGTVPCQSGVQGCDEAAEACTAVSAEWLAAFITLGGILVLGLLLAACCILPYCCVPRKVNEDALLLDEYNLKGRRRGALGRGVGRHGPRGPWARRGPPPAWWYDAHYYPTWWERLMYGI